MGVFFLEARGRDSSEGQFGLSFGIDLGLPNGSYKVICSLLPLVLFLVAFVKVCAVNHGPLPLVPGLEPFSEHHNVI